MPRALTLPALALGALLAFAPAASACPYCSLSQGTDTLLFVLGFLVIPYVVVSGVWFWMKRVLASERAEQRELAAAAEAGAVDGRRGTPAAAANSGSPRPGR